MAPNGPTNIKPEEFDCAVAVAELVLELRIERNDERVLQIESDDESIQSDGAEWEESRDSDAQSVLLEGDRASTSGFYYTTSESSSDSRSFVSTDYGSEIVSLNDPLSSDSEMDFDDAVINDDDGNPIDMSEVFLLGPSHTDVERRYNEILRARASEARASEAEDPANRHEGGQRAEEQPRADAGQEPPGRAAAAAAPHRPPDPLNPDYKPDPIAE